MLLATTLFLLGVASIAPVAVASGGVRATVKGLLEKRSVEGVAGYDYGRAAICESGQDFENGRIAGPIFGNKVFQGTLTSENKCMSPVHNGNYLTFGDDTVGNDLPRGIQTKRLDLSSCHDDTQFCFQLVKGNDQFGCEGVERGENIFVTITSDEIFSTQILRSDGNVFEQNVVQTGNYYAFDLPANALNGKAKDGIIIKFDQPEHDGFNTTLNIAFDQWAIDNVRFARKGACPVCSQARVADTNAELNTLNTNILPNRTVTEELAVVQLGDSNVGKLEALITFLGNIATAGAQIDLDFEGVFQTSIAVAPTVGGVQKITFSAEDTAKLLADGEVTYTRTAVNIVAPLPNPAFANASFFSIAFELSCEPNPLMSTVVGPQFDDANLIFSVAAVNFVGMPLMLASIPNVLNLPNRVNPTSVSDSLSIGGVLPVFGIPLGGLLLSTNLGSNFQILFSDPTVTVEEFGAGSTTYLTNGGAVPTGVEVDVCDPGAAERSMYQYIIVDMDIDFFEINGRLTADGKEICESKDKTKRKEK